MKCNATRSVGWNPVVNVGKSWAGPHCHRVLEIPWFGYFPKKSSSSLHISINFLTKLDTRLLILPFVFDGVQFRK